MRRNDDAMKTKCWYQNKTAKNYEKSFFIYADFLFTHL